MTVDFYKSLPSSVPSMVAGVRDEHVLICTRVVQIGVASAVGSDGSFLFTACLHKKKRVFRIWHFTAAANPRLTGHRSPLNLESVCSTKLRVLAARFEGRRWSLCLEISLVTWGPDPVLYQLFHVLYQLFAIQNRRSFPIRKKSSRNGSCLLYTSPSPRD